MPQSTYESGYDEKYGYNRNAFAHPPPSLKLVGLAVKGIAMPIGFVSEAIHDYKDRKKVKSKVSGGQNGGSNAAADATTAESASTEDTGSQQQQQMAYMAVPEEQANELITSGRAVPAEGHEPTHELVPADSQSPEGEEDDSEHVDNDEADWELDEAAGSQDAGNTATDVPVDDLIQTVQASSQQSQSKTSNPNDTTPAVSPSAPSTGINSQSSRLPYPVIIPQRRPGTKTRGFVRAYAPALSNPGIDEDTFLAFIDSLHQAAQSSPILQVLQIGAAAAGLYPDPVIGAAIQAVQVAVAIAQEVQERWKTNRFLERANRELFVPHGLFAMIVTYKPSKPQTDGVNYADLVQTRTIDLTAQSIAKYGGPALQQDDVGMRKKLQNRLRIGDGTTVGEAQMPLECAPLTFPALEQADTLARSDTDEKALARLKQSGRGASKWMDGFFDRRAQAKFAFDNPNSTLVKTSAGDPSASKEFKSRYADPNNAVNTHLFTLLTGGLWKAEPLGARRRWERNQRREAAARSAALNSMAARARSRGNGLKKTAAKRLLGEDVLYLQIVNMPSEEQLARARQELAAKK